LNPLIQIFEITRINFGKYTLETIALFSFMVFTLPIKVLLKKSHIVRPIKINTGKYCSRAPNTKPKMNVYISIKHRGSNIHHSQFRYELATSALSFDFADTTEYLKYFFRSRKALLSIQAAPIHTNPLFCFILSY
jgi:hypothetical protein